MEESRAARWAQFLTEVRTTLDLTSEQPTWLRYNLTEDKAGNMRMRTKYIPPTHSTNASTAGSASPFCTHSTWFMLTHCECTRSDRVRAGGSFHRL